MDGKRFPWSSPQRGCWLQTQNVMTPGTKPKYRRRRCVLGNLTTAHTLIQYEGTGYLYYKAHFGRYSVVCSTPFSSTCPMVYSARSFPPTFIPGGHSPYIAAEKEAYTCTRYAQSSGQLCMPGPKFGAPE